jgi:hypothetical protein
MTTAVRTDKGHRVNRRPRWMRTRPNPIYGTPGRPFFEET